MSANRIRHLGAAGLVVATSLLLVLAAHVGWTAAATGKSGASASGALQGHVSIHVKGKWLGPGKGDRGRFMISGAISDRGRVVDREVVYRGRPVTVRTLFGAKGNIRIKVGEIGPGPRCGCKWRITRGTKAYTGLRGRGREVGLYSSTVDITMSGTVSQWRRP